MADPMTIFAGMSMAGGIINAAGTMHAAEGAAASSEYNAAVSNRNAAMARQAADYNAVIQERQSRMQIEKIRAAYGASGVLQDGSVLDVIESSVTNAEMDRQQILYQGELKALGYEDSRELNLANAKSTRQMGMFQSMSQLLTGFTGAGKMGAIGKAETSAGVSATPGALPGKR